MPRTSPPTCGPTSTASPTTCGKCWRSSTSTTPSPSSTTRACCSWSLERFKNIDLHPDKVSNLEMGYIFEELIRKFNEAMDENPGEHFTPREVIRLMVNLLLSPGQGRPGEEPHRPHRLRLLLRFGRDADHRQGTDRRDQSQGRRPPVRAGGEPRNLRRLQVGPLSEDQRRAGCREHQVRQHAVQDQHADKRFDYLLTNPPYGKEWKMDQTAVEAEAERGYAGRFGAGLPRISDGQLLFLQHMLCRMKDPSDGGSRVAIVMNGSPLFTGDAGSGESEIRRWILENDWLEAIVALPEQLFYNTGIPTYVWVLTNRKPQNRKNKVQLIDATSFWMPMRKSLGDKRREICPEQIGEITKLFESFKEGEQSDIFPRPATSATARSPWNDRSGSTSRSALSGSNALKAGEGVPEPSDEQEEGQGRAGRNRSGPANCGKRS